MDPLEQPILLVDDNLDFLAFNSELLRAKGFALYTAASATEAIKIMSDRVVKLLVVDWHLGKQADGDHTSASLMHAARKSHPHIPIIVFSGLRDVDVWADASFNGADCFFQKPLKIEVLSEHIARWLRREQAATEAFWNPSQADTLPLATIRRMYTNNVVKQLNGNLSLAAEKLGANRQTIRKILNDGGRTGPRNTA